MIKVTKLEFFFEKLIIVRARFTPRIFRKEFHEKKEFSFVDYTFDQGFVQTKRETFRVHTILEIRQKDIG